MVLSEGPGAIEYARSISWLAGVKCTFSFITFSFVYVSSYKKTTDTQNWK